MALCPLAGGTATRDTRLIVVYGVERHIANLYGKLGARHRGDAVAAAFRLGLAPPEAPEPR